MEKENGKLDVDSATSIPNGDNGWELRLNGIKVEPQIGKLEEVWKNVTVEIVQMPNGEVSIGWKPQLNTERIL